MRRVCLILILAVATTAIAPAKNTVGQSVAQNSDKPKAGSDQKKEQFAAPPTKWDSRVNDVFFPDARAVLVGPRPPALTASVTGTAQKIAGASPSSNSAGGMDTGTATWSKLISADTLQDEVKSLAPLLADDVKTQQGFLGGGYKKSRRTLSLLAAAFAIVNEYDGDVRWKNQAARARFVRSIRQELQSQYGANLPRCQTAERRFGCASSRRSAGSIQSRGHHGLGKGGGFIAVDEPFRDGAARPHCAVDC